MRDGIWSWSGRYIGYRSSDSLFSFAGAKIGYFSEGEELYGPDGAYLGEIRSENRLIRNLAKTRWTRRSFVPEIMKAAPPQADLISKPMLAGFEDFPISVRHIQ